MEGYETFNTELRRDERANAGAIVGGCFVLIPFLWTMDYDPTHTYELKIKSNSPQGGKILPQNNNTHSKADQLRDLKDLLDKGIITQEEFNKEKKKILDQ
jgi:hypothetical protein